MQIRLLTSDPNAPPAGPSATLSLHYDKWINAYQTEIWETVTLPPRKHHDFKVLDQIGTYGADHERRRFQGPAPRYQGIRRLELSFRENNIDLPFGYTIGNPEWDNNFIRNHQCQHAGAELESEHGRRFQLPNRLSTRPLFRQHRQHRARAVSQRHDGA